MSGGNLAVRGLGKAYAGVRALDDVSISIAAGEIVGLIGPNGSGKTTAIDCVTGLQRPDTGTVELDGTDVTSWRPDRLAHHGLVRTFQQVRTFESLTVRHNLRVAALGRRPRSRRLADLVRPDGKDRALRARLDELVDTFALGPVADRPAGQVSYGQRKLVEFAAACVVPPRVLLLDEPVAAVNPTIGNLIRDRIRDLNAAGTTVLLVEHNIELVVGLCHRVVVLDQGRTLAQGRPEEVLARDDVQEAYLGG
ncbi:ABC transporter ATP-binding protein [Micromonospora sagamiensis]|uniref:Branched-chain amino acid transport system ATP-binding protein n=1 Tax=Micromonospora sagamiensis TaxID=47875 RepID=A0A562WFA9_9ACTN|nr:ABC transporter ATP-binding protein [Micromonospora sagamiensis]TWJ28815.1 branched-chain amino acid transport system ATP-binding protein [Micromonospora sagamiensis]BCL12279.1 ABC transporter ATP-binding protein [Micromonospora sagamiensis]